MPNPLKTFKPFLMKHAPDILMYTGLAGLVGSLAMTVKSTVDATNLVNDKKAELKKDKLSASEILKTVWKCYIPPVVMTVISIPCIIMGNRVYSKRNAALAAAYTISETALQEYQNKTKEIAGEKKEQQIKEAVAKSAIDSKSPNASVIVSGDGKQLFYEEITGRYFYSTWNEIEKAVNKMNAKAMDGADTITLNEWFQSIGLSPVETGEERGWSVYKNGYHELIKISMIAMISKDNTPCAVVHYEVRPYDLNGF